MLLFCAQDNDNIRMLHAKKLDIFVLKLFVALWELFHLFIYLHDAVFMEI